jgi:hypothetical protein
MMRTDDQTQGAWMRRVMLILSEAHRAESKGERP